MRKIALLLFVFLALQTTSGQSFQDTIPFNNDLGLIVIPITFNGEVKQFVFDTGAQVSLSYGLAKETLKPTRKTTTVASSS